ncbi:DNA-cytosine methyltransferase [Kluyvera intermedia]|nr:DNA-cytosine methyltransferase [Kluyvera intermedia]
MVGIVLWGEKNFDDPQNQLHRPRRLTPRECARLMGFESPQGYQFRIPVSDTQAYRQFGNSVIVPVFAAVARLLESRILQSVALRQAEKKDGGRSR